MIAAIVYDIEKNGRYSMIKALLFDMDGLMADTEKATYSIWKKVYADHGYDLTVPMYARTCGMDRDDTKKLIYSYFHDDTIYDTCRPIWLDEYARMCREGQIPLKKGLIELLDYCDTHVLRKVVVSTSTPERISAVLSPSGVYGRMDAYVTSLDVTRPKPDPQPFELGAEAAGFSASESLALEDSMAGVESGKRAGCRVICVPDLVKPDEAHRKYIDCVCESLLDVIPWIEKINHGEMK